MTRDEAQAELDALTDKFRAAQKQTSEYVLRVGEDSPDAKLLLGLEQMAAKQLAEARAQFESAY